MPQVLTSTELFSTTAGRGNQGVSDDDFYIFCMAHRDLHIERTAEGEIVIMPPAGYESDHRNVDAVFQLAQWARKDGRGKVSGSSAVFYLPDGSALSPDAAWVSNESLSRIPKQAKKKF